MQNFAPSKPVEIDIIKEKLIYSLGKFVINWKGLIALNSTS
jgi:hypothetical protein